MEDILLCPSCRKPFKNRLDPGHAVCDRCGFIVQFEGTIPLLVNDRLELNRRIEISRKKSGDDWFATDQLCQKRGPYRHHINKRTRNLQAVVRGYLDHHQGQQIFGLDLGCGDGVNTGWLSGLCNTCYASDYNLLRLRRMAVVYQCVGLFLADITEYPVADNAFDIILFNHVLEHIPDDLKALKEVRRVLAKKGLVILGVPNEGAFFWRLAYRLQPQSLAMTDHVHFYTEDSLKKICEEAGFIITGALRIGWGIPHWSIDAVVRRYKFFDDLFEWAGKTIFPHQATSLYLFLSKNE